MRTSPRRVYAWLVVGPMVLLLVGLVLLAGLAVLPDQPHGPSNYRVLDVTLGGVACPRSFVSGWSRGSGASVVFDAAPCPRGSTPAVWLGITWQGGQRTSLCLDPGATRC